ncbi:response regulator [Desulfovibrio aminophilus]|nr:response regulator [Desulfovibrio aminophilus]MCM0754503.1 response regulator [Desulfovibrio aminophilus]
MRPSVMIVDDEAPIRKALVDFLEDYDEFRLRAAASGEEALESLRAEPADLCVVDMRLPGMRGEEFIVAAAEGGLCRRFVLHTGSVGPVLGEALSDLGLTEADVFRKPCDSTAILERARVLLSRTAEE